jgi:hypothetical protein
MWFLGLPTAALSKPIFTGLGGRAVLGTRPMAKRLPGKRHYSLNAYLKNLFFLDNNWFSVDDSPLMKIVTSKTH